MKTTTEPLEGGVYIDRKVLNHSVFLRPDYGWAWVFLLLLANDKSRTVTLSGRRVEVKRGQLVWSLSGLQRKLGKGRKWFTAFLEFCKDEGMMTVQTHAHGAVITILNYEIYNPLPKISNGQDVSRGEANTGPQQPQNTNEQSTGFAEIPSDLEVETFCNQFTDMARGIPKIPDNWWRGWLSIAIGRTTFPKDWKRAIKLAFVSDWDGGHPKARGILKNSAPDNSHGGDWMPQRERGELLQLIKTAMDRGDKVEEASLRKELAVLR